MECCLIEDRKVICTFADLRKRACEVGPLRVGVVEADDDVVLMAASDALALHIALPVLIGNEKQIRLRAKTLGLFELAQRAEFIAGGENTAMTAVKMAREGYLEVLMKGHLRTDQLLHPVLDKDRGLRTGRLLSDVAFFEYPDPGGARLVGITDGGLNIAPELDQKKQIIISAIEVLHRLGVARPRIAIMSAVELVSEAMQSTLDARALTQMGMDGVFGETEVFGPLALDNALFASAAKAKGIDHPVAGHADCLVVPTIEAGNLLAKAIVFLAGWEFAHLVVGAKVPILIPSRVETARDKVNAMALGVLYAAG